MEGFSNWVLLKAGPRPTPPATAHRPAARWTRPGGPRQQATSKLSVMEGFSNWVLLKAGPRPTPPATAQRPAARWTRPGGPRPVACHGLAARGPWLATAWRPAARGLPRPGGPRPAARGPRWPGSLEARWPSPDFQQIVEQRINSEV